MKLLAFFTLAALSLENVQAGWKRLGDEHDRNLGGEYTNFNSDDAYGLCLGVEASICNCNPKLALGTGCTGFRIRSSGLLQSELDSDYCIQAGYSWPPEAGKKLRLHECDESNRLQRFDYSDGVVIKLKDTDFCVVFEGQNGTVGDHIVIEKCSKTDGQDNWSTD